MLTIMLINFINPSRRIKIKKSGSPAIFKSSIFRGMSTLLISGQTNMDISTHFEYDSDLLDFSRKSGYCIVFNGEVLVCFPAREYFYRLLHLFRALQIGSNYQKDKFAVKEYLTRTN